MRQCRDVWLAEVTQTLRRADPLVQRLFTVTRTGIGVLGHKQDEWGCLLMTATSTEALQGQHRKDMSVIVEEASGVDRELIEQFKGTLSNPGAIFLQIGNPNTRDCAFFDCFNSQAHKWVGLHWNAEETPDTEWFDSQRNTDISDEFGIDSDVYRIRVLGEFPHADPNCVMSTEDIIRCMDKSLMIPMSRVNSHVRQFGIDFARFGGDESVVIRRSGMSVVQHWWKNRVDPNDVVDKSFRMQYDAGWTDAQTWFVCDAGGIGQGVMGNFHRAQKHIYEFHSGGKANRHYENKITQAWFEFAKHVRNTNCYIPRDNMLLRQLGARQYFTTKKGKLILESKDEYMKRGYESPDRADGAVMAFWENPVAQAQIATQMARSRSVGDV